MTIENVLDQQVIKETTSPVFLQTKAEKLIRVDPNVKLIKAKDYEDYFDASLLLDEAREALEKSKMDIVELCSQAKKDAYQEGVIQANELIAKAHVEMTLLAKEYIQSFKEGLPDVILDIVRKFIHDFDDVDFLMRSINSSIRALGSDQKIEIHVSDLVINNVKNRMRELAIDTSLITLISDSSMGKKDCLVVTSLGIINANLELQLQNIEQAVRKGFSQND